MPDFHVIPSIEQVRRRPAIRSLEARFGAAATVAALREAAADVRDAIAAGEAGYATEDAVTARLETASAARLGEAFRPSLIRVINASGVILHTNLGRAPLAAAAIDRIAE